MPHLSQCNEIEIFIDANIWLYAFTAHPRWGKSSHQLLKKIEAGEITGCISHLVITETIHKLMLFEACDRFHLSRSDAINYLKKNFKAIKTLLHYRQALRQFHQLPNLKILEISHSVFSQSYSIIKEYQVLSTDAVHLATCLLHNVNHIATNDKDFKRMRRLTTWWP